MLRLFYYMPLGCWHSWLISYRGIVKMLTEWKLWRRSYLRFIHTCEVNTIFRKNGSESGNTFRISPGGTTSRLVLFAATLPEEFVLKNFQYKFLRQSVTNITSLLLSENLCFFYKKMLVFQNKSFFLLKNIFDHIFNYSYIQFTQAKLIKESYQKCQATFCVGLLKNVS